MKDDFAFDMSDISPIIFKPDYYNSYPSFVNRSNVISHFHLKTSIMSCSTCSYHEGDYTLPLNNMHASFMIVGETPYDVHFETEHGQILSHIIRQLHVDLDHIYLTSIKKSVEAVDPCHKHLSSEVIVIQPKMIVALGYGPANSLSDQIDFPGQGKTLINGSDFVVTHSLEDIIHEPSKYEELFQHMQMAFNQWQFRLQQQRSDYNYSRV